MRRVVLIPFLALCACSADITIVANSDADLDAAVRDFMGEFQLEVKRVARSDNAYAVHLEGDPDAREMVPLGAALDRIIEVQPSDSPLILKLTDEGSQDGPEEVALSYNASRGGVGLYSRAHGPTLDPMFSPPGSMLCVWELAADNLPPMGQQMRARDDLPPELQDAAAQIADTFNSVGLTRAHEFRLGGEVFETGAERVEFQDDRVLFVFEEKTESSSPSMLGLPPAKFRACTKTVMRRASDPFIANVMFPTLSAAVQSYSTD